MQCPGQTMGVIVVLDAAVRPEVDQEVDIVTDVTTHTDEKGGDINQKKEI